jgi:hypothetical protein
MLENHWNNRKNYFYFVGRAVRVGVTCDEIDRVSGMYRVDLFSAV